MPSTFLRYTSPPVPSSAIATPPKPTISSLGPSTVTAGRITAPALGARPAYSMIVRASADIVQRHTHTRRVHNASALIEAANITRPAPAPRGLHEKVTDVNKSHIGCQRRRHRSIRPSAAPA